MRYIGLWFLLCHFLHYLCIKEPVTYSCGNDEPPLLLVSTLDGFLSALELENGGYKKWSVLTEPGSLLSSNIHELELSDKSQWIRMIPSLSGGLYKFNGEEIQPIPLNADNLLQTSFRFSDEVVISGGKEIRTYGIDAKSGKILYECSMTKCGSFSDSKENLDMILLRRDTQTVHAIEPRTGVERWNFSVGHHEVKLTHDVPDCRVNLKNHLDYDVKVAIPDGSITLLNTSNDGSLIWKHEFSAPVVSVWKLSGGVLTALDLFETAANSLVSKDELKYAALYIGMHNKQLYIQESEILLNQMSKMHFYDKRIADETFPTIQWKPIPASDFISNESNSIVHIPDDSTALSVLYASEYINGNGYFLEGMRVPLLMEGNEPATAPEIISKNSSNVTEGNASTIIFEPEMSTLEYLFGLYWREAIILLLSAGFVNCMLMWYFAVSALEVFKFHIQSLTGNKFFHQEEENEDIPKSSTTRFVTVDEACEENNALDAGRSHYFDNFETRRCLGKGGFGIVYQAVNKMDGVDYAIKRITLLNEADEDRVMREVKALAKLDHENIVRYFGSWQEDPSKCPIWEFPTETDSDSVKWSNKSCIMSGNDGSFVKSSTRMSKLRDTFKYVKRILSMDKQGRNMDSSFIVFEEDEQVVEDIEAPKVDEAVGQVWEIDEKIVAVQRKKSVKLKPYSYVFIQMQLCRKDSLREWLWHHSKRDRAEVLGIFQQILNAVEYIHLNNLIHRDLKPSNILFSLDGKIKVSDFGLVKTSRISEIDAKQQAWSGSSGGGAHSQGIHGELHQDHHHENHTAHVGTQLYMSPEQLNGQTYNHKVDIYSLGIILFELLTPFSTQMERCRTLSDLRKGEYPKKFPAKYPEEHELLTLMLSVCPESRPTTYYIKSRPPLYSQNSLEKGNEKWDFQLPPLENY